MPRTGDSSPCESFLDDLRSKAVNNLPWGNLAPPVDVPSDIFTCLFREALHPQRVPDGWFVWRDLGSEVAIDVGQTRVGLLQGFVICGVRMLCDQIISDHDMSGQGMEEMTAELTVPLATGTRGEPAGLIMTGEIAARGHPLLVDAWGDVAVVGCWTAVVDVALRVAAAAGTDIAGGPLLPGAVWTGTASGPLPPGAVPTADNVFTVVPQARHAIDVKTGTGAGRR